VEILEILKRAKGDSGEGIPWNADPKDVRQEINHRTWKAGYTDRDGIPRPDRGDGKGDWERPIDKKKYRENYVKIFKHD
jgi:hypothetical protein